MKGHTPIPENVARFTTDEILRATNGSLQNAAPGTERSREHLGVTSDSRGVKAGSVFVALVGEKNDAHDFVDGAIQKGATAVLVRRGFQPEAVSAEGRGVAIIEVDDTLVALGALARFHLERWRARSRGKVIAITGSAGKTTTKELTRALLEVRATPHATLGNLNNRVGVPFVVLGLLPSHSHLVAEVGMSLRHEISALAAIVDPDVAIITNIGGAHAEGVGGRDLVATEKGDLFAALRKDALAIQNLVDAAVGEQVKRTLAKRVTFGKEGATYRLNALEVRGAEGSRLTVTTPSGSGDILFPFLGEGQALDLLAAWAAVDKVLEAPLTLAEVSLALRQLSPLSGRARVTKLADGTVLIDDSYNANPTSMRASIESASQLAKKESRRLVLVLGEMKELGAEAEKEHAALAEVVRHADAAVVLGCGGLIEHSLKGVAGARILGSAEEAKAEALEQVRAGDVVLVKGSRSVGTEIVAEALVFKAETSAKKAGEPS